MPSGEELVNKLDPVSAQANERQTSNVEDSAELTEEEREVIELLRTPKLSIKYLDEPTKQRIRNVVHHLHHERGISLVDIAKIIGNKTSGYVSWLFRQLGIKPREFEESRLKAIKEKRRKYERKPFDGTDEDKAYLLGVRHGDFSVSIPFGEATRISTSTTHPALAKLFTDLLSPYGHVYKHPRYKKDTRTYEWNFHAIVDNSFRFLLTETKVHWDWIAKKKSTILSYLAGLWDAEGSVGIFRNSNVVAIHAIAYNTNKELLTFVKDSLRLLGFNPIGLFLDKRKGSITSKYRIERKKDYWKVLLANLDESQALLRRLPLRHQEKAAKRKIALSVKRGDRWVDVKPRVEALRKLIRSERDLFVKEAETEYRQKHPDKNN